jgi:hypothetical protein
MFLKSYRRCFLRRAGGLGFHGAKKMDYNGLGLQPHKKTQLDYKTIMY